MSNDIQEQNILLKSLLKVVVNLLPEHSPDCGVHRAHPSYRNTYCSCKLKELRIEINNLN